MDDRFVTLPNAAAPAAPERASPRDSMFLHATLRRAGTDHPLRVRNLSTGGLMAECGANLAPGEPVEVELRGVGCVGGRIAWRTEARVGIAFDRPIDAHAARKPVGMARSHTTWKRPTVPSRRPGLSGG